MDRITGEFTGERAIRAWSGAAAAAVAGLFLAGVVVESAGAQEPSAAQRQQQPAARRERKQSPLSKRVGLKAPERTPLPPGIVRGAGGAAVQPAAIYTAEVLDVPDAGTVVVRRASTGQTLRIKLFGVTATPATTAAAREATEEVRRGVKGQTVQVRHQIAPGPGEKAAAAVATVYLVPGPASEGGQAAAAAGAPVTGGDRPPVALRPFTGGVDPSGTARDLAVGAPGTTAGTTSATVSQGARPLSIPGGLRLTLNEGVIRSGAARWDAHEAPEEGGLEAAQEDARKAGRGLWSASGVVRGR